ncbi:MAG: ribosomal protein S18-alanine N-acetyltransferase [Clostridiales Family XIII bacterium]|nr:ribosomal protein S18-alanine N-acetyltransferase [Clostridiales Family XIII bacterium]
MNWIRIRRARPEDVDDVTALERICFATPWARSDLEKDIGENILASYMIAESADRLIGYAGIWVVIDEGHITNVAVHPDWRGQGVATMLLSELLETARRKGAKNFTLEARASNATAIALYEKFGFRTVGYRRQYYADNGEDAAIMWLKENAEE